VEEAVARALGANGAVIDAVFACPYHRDGVDGWVHPAHPARKPRPGMLLAAKRFLNLSLKHSWIVGDKLDDLQAGYHAGFQGGLHVLTGHGAAHRQAAKAWKHPRFDLRLGKTIADAAVLLDLLAL
jgi:D-glycero-D-manno-heptose 1,7-bisphosphate phosphatase